MKINRDTALIKAHYFTFFAGMVPIFPFFIVLGVGLGVPIALQGALGAAIMVFTIFAKPVLSLIADAVPTWRKSIFLGAVLASGLSFGCICFVKAFGVIPYYSTVFIQNKHDNRSNLLLMKNENSSIDFPFSFDENVVQNITLDNALMLLHNNDSCKLLHGHDCRLSPNNSILLQLTLFEEIETEEKQAYFTVSSSSDGYLLTGEYDSLECAAGSWSGDCHGNKVFKTFNFWVFATLLLVGTVAFSTANSFTDAVTVETIGPNGNYGSQRAWGSAGWGLVGPVSGLLVDYWSGDSEVKDYTPAFVLVFVIMGVDVILSANLKVPKLEVSTKVWASVWPLLRQPRFFLFLLFSILNGCFDACILNFIFVLQEDMAAGTEIMKNIKFIQGMTLFVQCASETPCMFMSDRLVKKIGADKVTTLVLGLHTIRLFLITCVGTWGTVWLTVAVEIMNGPCYGFGYSAIVVYAGQLSPPGASTTVQSIANVSYECIGYAVSTLLSGLIVSNIGSVKMFLVWAIVGAVTTVLHCFYVKCVPPIKEDLINRPIAHKMNGTMPGTVEEELCLHGPTENTITESVGGDEGEPDTLSEVSDQSVDYNEDKYRSLDYLKGSFAGINGLAPSSRGSKVQLGNDSFDTLG